MKPVIIFFFFAASLLVLSSCKKEAANEKILINFINKTGAKIENAIADNIQIGNIDDNGQTGFINFEKFGIDTQMPNCNFVGIQNKDTVKSTSIFYWCGTEKSQLEPGMYNIEIKLYTTATEKYFNLHFK